MRDIKREDKMTKHIASMKVATLAGVLLASAVLSNSLLAGCGGGTPAAPSSASDVVNTYQGVANVTAGTPFPDYLLSWALVIGQTESSFRFPDSYTPNTDGIPYDVISGTYASDGGFFALNSTDINTAGLGSAASGQSYALVLPERAALLRPGAGTTPLIVLAGMNDCTVAQKAETFLFISLPGMFWNAVTSAAYGTVQASTDAQGDAWSFSGQDQFLLSGGAATSSPYPSSFTGTCGQGLTGYSIGVLPTTTSGYFDPTISVSPSGFFTETATGQETTTMSGITNYAQQPFVGMVAPSSALSTSSVVAAKYLGFLYESLPSSGNQSLTTQPISFGSETPGSGTTMTGGLFPNGDPSQTPATNVTVNLGIQSASQNGLYTAVTVTIPDTSVAGTCANNGGTAGTTASGSLTCSFSAVAIAGNPGNNFAVFVLGLDPTQQQAPFGLYLYQQQ